MGSAVAVIDRELLTRVIQHANGFTRKLEVRPQGFKRGDLLKCFPDDGAVEAHLKRIFWPNGPVCPRCGFIDHLGSGTDPYRCNACDRQFTVRTGTIFERSKVELHKWFRAILLLAMTPPRKRLSSRALAEWLGVRQPTAWAMLRKISTIWYRRHDILRGIFNDEVNPWPFFSAHRDYESEERTKATFVPGDYSPAPDELLIDPDLMKVIEAKARTARDQGALAEPKRPDPKKDFADRRLNGKLGERERRWIEWIERVNERRRHRTSEHAHDHIPLLPFKWLSQRDCPMCRHGMAEWLHWEGCAVHFEWTTWCEFWEWIGETLGNWLEQRVMSEELAEERYELEFAAEMGMSLTAYRVYAKQEAALQELRYKERDRARKAERLAQIEFVVI